MLVALAAAHAAPPSPFAPWPDPLAQRSDLEAAWSAGPDHLVAVGRAGAVLTLRDGASTIEGVADVDLHAVWGTGPDDVWAVGDQGTVVHRGAAGWEPVAFPVEVDLLASRPEA